ncbi:unnamed protein product [Phyllotreta striolata]|uniref:serine--tRNA ligase n=1 Tax=Phyllotreta striolata TaxID=444603 RepID=A0A9N9XM81_PHYSR|nr:unnamed protein product [Phyllotreta striolata]
MFTRHILSKVQRTNRIPKCNKSTSSWKFPELNAKLLCDSIDQEKIEENILRRKGVGNIKLVRELTNQLERKQTGTEDFEALRTQLAQELLKIPNRTHPDVFDYGDKPKLVKLVNDKRTFTDTPLEFSQIAKKLKMVRTEHLGNVSGSRSYYILGELAELEQALLDYFVHELIQSGFEFVSVPDILPRTVIERCGMTTKGDRNQVYTLDSKLHEPDLCLSGTSEMALAGYLAGETFKEADLPKKLAALSRCYRAEISSTAEERGIFRVHEFTKVEMFVVTAPETSDGALEEIRTWEEEKFKALGLHFQVLDMPPHELGAQAYRKYDIEAWMPGRGMYGEISSCSNCTDYQSRRLDIKYERKDGKLDYVHTLNGTACAIPRLLIALVENGQNQKGFIELPDIIQDYMRGKRSISKQKSIPELKLIKNKK